MTQTRFVGKKAVILHRCANSIRLLAPQLERLGMSALRFDVGVDSDFDGIDFCFFDVDVGYNDMFPWAGADAPIPLIALVGFETLGRLEWMLAQHPCALLNKPVSANGVLTSLVVAHHEFARRRQTRDDANRAEEDLRARRLVLEASFRLMQVHQISEKEAYNRLRHLSQDRGVPLFLIAAQILNVSLEELRNQF